ncbi:MAG: hypothetical protein ABSB70_06880 [Candidatus Velthaea sp.]|jgi:hypothetical protein
MRIFVGGLPQRANKDDIVRLFRQFGANETGVVLPRDRRTRRRKGFAYVEIPDAERARAAIDVFSGFSLDGKALTVCVADERPKKRPRRLPAVLLAICALGTSVSSTARADEASADLGLTLNPVLYGLHESFNDRVHVPPVPIPLIEFRERYGPFELDLSGLPGVASVRSDDITQGRTSTQLSVFTGMLRVWDPLHRFSAGIGQTLYNQSTHYLDPVEIAGTGERQFSRVTGLTYQAGYAVPYHAGRFEAVFNYAPAMVGTQYTTYDVAQYAPRINPEKAGQIDTGVRYVHSIGTHSEAIIGLRYLNYTSSYVGGRGGLSDRNVGLLAVVGLRTRIGR